jgi:peroxiredoxin
MYNSLRSFLLCFFLLCFSGMILCVSGLQAAPSAVIVITAQGTVSDGPAAAHFDFGTHVESDDSPLVHVFLLRNISSVPISLERLETSCGCTTAVAGETEALPLTIAPGQTAPIRIQVSPRRLLLGDVHKFVWAYFHGAEDAPILLEMRGTERNDVLPARLSASSSVRQKSGTEISTLKISKLNAGQPAPMLTGTDTLGRKFALTAFRGHPTVVLFFCGCPWCAAAARSWGHVQRMGRLPAGTHTVVVFAGDNAATRAFAASNGLDRRHTTLLPDPNAHLTESVYNVSSCPRVFALDVLGIIRYTNNHTDDQPRQASASTLTNRLQASLPR